MATAPATERMIALAERGLPVHHRDRHHLGHAPGGDSDRPVTVYTDGCVSHTPIARGLGRLTGWGYLSTTGHYGCGRIPQFLTRTGSVPVVTELRAVWHAVRYLISAQPVTVITDSVQAAKTLTAWQHGSTDMPTGYRGRTTGIPVLEQLRREIATHAGNLAVEQVKGHSGTILNEAADALAQLGMRWARDQLANDDVAARARGLAKGYLAQWVNERP